MVYALLEGNAAAVDLQPGELKPQPAGSDLVQIAYGQLERKGTYRNGDQVSAKPSLDTTFYHVRYMHYGEVATVPTVFYAQQAWGSLHGSGLAAGNQNTSGNSDTVFLFALWPYSNKETQTHWALALYYQPNNGSYDSRKSVNLGENRERIALQTGYQTRVLPDLDLMIAFDSVDYGDNRDYTAAHATLSQQRLNTWQAAGKYSMTSRAALGLSLFHVYGGVTSVNGVSRDDETRTNRYILTGSYSFPELNSLFQLNYGRDIQTQNGTLESKRLILRYTQRF